MPRYITVGPWTDQGINSPSRLGAAKQAMSAASSTVLSALPATVAVRFHAEYSVEGRACRGGKEANRSGRCRGIL